MAKATGISEATVRRIWHALGLKPHLVKTFEPKPFIWTAQATDILEKVKRARAARDRRSA